MKWSVWAPRANRLELEIGEKRSPMKRTEHGWWTGDVHAVPGTDYYYVLEGQPLPDPRSLWQPYGVHGPSRVFNHAAFVWRDRGWNAPPLSSAVLYELHIGTFTPEGTFDAVITRLDHLVDLGITHVELMPVSQFSGNHGWGYDGVDLYAPHSGYGGPEGLKRLVDACHAQHLAVILDVVYNHLGPEGNYLSRFGPYFSDCHSTPWGPAVNLDGPGSDEVRRFFCDNALMWLEDYHMDGLRIDAVHAFHDDSAVHFLEQLKTEAVALEARLGRHLVIVAESDLNDPRLVRSTDSGGYGLDAQWSDDFHHALHTVLTGERDGYYADFGSMTALGKALASSFIYDGCYSVYRGRRHGRRVDGLSGNRFVVYSQNHDHIGNRAKGDRTAHLINTGRLKVAAALVMTAPFLPMLFQGEEWGAKSPFLYFTDHGDDQIRKAVTEGRQREFQAFGWKPDEIADPQDPASFKRSKLQWDERDLQPHVELLDWHRRLIRLRREAPELSDGRMDLVQVTVDEDQRWIRMARGSFVVLGNLHSTCQHVPVEGGRLKLLLGSDPEILCTNEGVSLPPDSVAIVRNEADVPQDRQRVPDPT